jgi:hypothetical protein
MSREAMQMALEALEGNCTNPTADPEQAANEDAAITALRQALETEKQEPVAWKDKTYGNLHHQDFGNSIPLYTAPPKREWVGLTDDEVEDIYFDKFSMSELVGFARSIEQALKDKNGGEYRNKATTERTKLNQENT